jgi:hypothetical protein
MDAVVKTNVLGWLDCIALVGAIVGTVAASRFAPAGAKRGLTLIPPGWLGVALGVDLLVAALSFVHGSVPMVAGLAQRSDPMGLYVASLALLLVVAQVVAAWLAPVFLRSSWFVRISVGNVVVIALLGLGHLALNGGNLPPTP